MTSITTRTPDALAAAAALVARSGATVVDPDTFRNDVSGDGVRLKRREADGIRAGDVIGLVAGVDVHTLPNGITVAECPTDGCDGVHNVGSSAWQWLHPDNASAEWLRSEGLSKNTVDRWVGRGVRIGCHDCPEQRQGR